MDSGRNKTRLRFLKLLGFILVVVGAILTLVRLVELQEDLDDKCSGNQCEELDVFWWFWAFQIFVLIFLAVVEILDLAETCCLTLLGLSMVASTLDQYAADIFRTGVNCSTLAVSGWAVMAGGHIIIIMGLGYRHVYPPGKARPWTNVGEPEAAPLTVEQDEPGQVFSHSPVAYVLTFLLAFGSWLMAVAGAREFCNEFACTAFKFYWWLLCLELLVLLFVFIMRAFRRLSPWTRASTFLLAMPTTFLAVWSHNFVDFAGEDYPNETALKVAAVGTIGLTITNYLLTLSLGFQMRSRPLRQQPVWVGLLRMFTIIMGVAGWAVAFVGVKRTHSFLCEDDDDDLYDEKLFCNKFDLFWWFFALEGAVLLAFLVSLFVNLKGGWSSVMLTFAAVASVWPIFIADKFRTFPVIDEGSRDEFSFDGHAVMAAAFLGLVAMEVF